MAIQGGPDIVEDGLVLHLDAAEPLCFRGEPTTNLMPYSNGINANRVNWPNGAYTHSIETTGEFAGWEKMVATTTGSISNVVMRLGDVTLSPGTVYTTTIEYYSPYSNLKFKWSGAYGNSDLIRIGYTNKYYLTYTFGAPSAANMGLWLNTIATTPANTAITNGVIYYRRAQFEQKPYYTDFTIGTRGSTVATGGGLLDLTNNGNNGTINRVATPSAAFYNGDNKGSLVFNGVNDYIDCTKISNTGDISICTFIRPASYDASPQHNPRIFMNYDGINDIQIILRESSKFVWGSSNLSQGAGTTNLPELNKWTHVAVTRSSSNYIIYYDGIVQTAITTVPGNPLPTSQILRIGADIQSTSSNGHFNGLIANFGIYNHALSANEVQQNYNATKGRFGL